jgi:hypothetical protein
LNKLRYSYINTRGNWENEKLCENSPPFGCRVSTQFLVFPISTCVDITVYQHGKFFYLLNQTLIILDDTPCQRNKVGSTFTAYCINLPNYDIETLAEGEMMNDNIVTVLFRQLFI